ncbi:hypothetical protein [Clostridium fungisolvens]|uniref:Uncharacterized protein n=1 Tax=Clostridium fungisolvens TaxID=1604897 RepID=A0A6V8SGD6_9CLOT|nr:hypothetical protein [Clostridium fungisolvens]GFP74208.1 hypothetical protein bsdtw1_00253 [Clostridium fungisolvens]
MMDRRVVKEYLSPEGSELILKENNSSNLNHKEKVIKNEKSLN